MTQFQQDVQSGTAEKIIVFERLRDQLLIALADLGSIESRYPIRQEYTVPGAISNLNMVLRQEIDYMRANAQAEGESQS